MDDTTPTYYPRKCDRCGCGMNAGYYVHDYVYEYLCSAECLDKVMPLLTYVQMFHDNRIFWTDWHKDEPEYVQVGNKTMRIEEFNAKNNKQ